MSSRNSCCLATTSLPMVTRHYKELFTMIFMDYITYINNIRKLVLNKNYHISHILYGNTGNMKCNIFHYTYHWLSYHSYPSMEKWINYMLNYSRSHKHMVHSIVETTKLIHQFFCLVFFLHLPYHLFWVFTYIHKHCSIIKHCGTSMIFPWIYLQ